MGRTKYSEETVNVIMAAFVTAARNIIQNEGIKAASIRHISEQAGYSSGTLYLYFDGIDELVTMALVANLSGYVDELVETSSENESAKDRYYRTWQLFCKHGFAQPAEYLQLFFGPQSENVDSISKKYHELFPEELLFANGPILRMLEHGSLAKRNHAVLEPYARELGLTDQQIDIANDLTIAYFGKFLHEAAAHELAPGEAEALSKQFLEGAHFILEK